MPFPFGLEAGCFAREQFHLTCKNATSAAALELEGAQVIDLNVNNGLIKYSGHFLQTGDAYPFTRRRNLFMSPAGSNLVNFAVATLTCVEAQQNITGYACVSSHSRCMEVNAYSDYIGYRCGCLDGFQGNPYIDSGCQGTHGIYYLLFFYHLHFKIVLAHLIFE